MKKRLLAMLLAMLMVVGTLPMTVFADPGDPATITEAGQVATKDGVSVMLADHGQQTAPWDAVSLTVGTKRTEDGATVVPLTLSVTNPKPFENGADQEGKWIGIGVPAGTVGTPGEGHWYGDGSAFYFGTYDYSLSDYKNKGYAWPGGYTAGGYLPNTTLGNGDRYVNQYWDIESLKIQNTNKGFIVAKNPTVESGSVTGWTYVIYDITFEVLGSVSNVKAALVDSKSTFEGVKGTLGNDTIELGAWDSKRTDEQVVADTNFPWIVVSYNRVKGGAVKFILQRQKADGSWEDAGTALTAAPTTPNAKAYSALPLASFTNAGGTASTGFFADCKNIAGTYRVGVKFDNEETVYASENITIASDASYAAEHTVATLTATEGVATAARTATATVGKYYKGETVTVTLDPATGYQVKADAKLTYSFQGQTVDTTANASAVTKGANADGKTTFSFVMPGADVTLVPLGDLFEAVPVVPTVVAAPIVGHPDASTEVTTGLGKVEVSAVTAVTGEANTYSLTLTGTNIVSHKNAQGNDGCWVGFGMPIANATDTYSYTVGGTAVSTIADRKYQVGDDWYNTVYFDEAGTYNVVQTKGSDTVTYKVTVVINKAPAIIKAPIEDHPTAGETKRDELGTVTATLTATDTAETYNVTLTGTDIKEHRNEPGMLGYWVGFGMPIANNTDTYSYTVDGTAVSTIAGRKYQEDGKWYNTVYFSKNGNYIVVQKKGSDTVATYNVTVAITPVVVTGTAYTEADVKPANLTGWTAGTPSGGHANPYTAVLDETTNTITITATNLEPTVNSQSVNAYWVGLALKHTDGNTYAKGFGTRPDDRTSITYGALTSNQTEDVSGTATVFDTTYWGWPTADKFAASNTGWLSVKSANGSIVDYKVKFELTPKTEDVTDATTIIAAPIADHSEDHVTDLGTVAVSNVKKADKTYYLTLTGNDIVAHENANGDEGAWVGFGMPIEGSTGAGYTYQLRKADGTLDTAIGSVPGRVHTVGAKSYNTIYFDTAGTYDIVQKKDGTVVAAYVVTVVINERPVTPVIEAVPANLTGWTASDPAGGHADPYSAVLNGSAITITATDLEKTVNSAGTRAYWVGVGLTHQDGAEYAWGYGSIDEASFSYGASTDSQTVGGKNYDTLYWGAPSENDPTFWTKTTTGFVSVKVNGTITNYTVTFNVTPEIEPVVEGTPYAKDDVKAANLTYADGAEAPAFGHATEYGVAYDPAVAAKTITIKAHGLEKTENSEGDTHFWVGLALKQNAGYTYAKGFGTKPATGVTYNQLTTTQTVGTDTYVTTYWGFRTPESIQNNPTGWLSVKEADGKIVDYVVNFDISVTGTVTAGLDENGKVDVSDEVINGLVQAAIAGKDDSDIADDAGTASAPVATIVAATAEGETLEKASVDVSVDTLLAANAGGVSVALEVEDVGTMTLTPGAILAATSGQSGTLTLEVARVTASDLEEDLPAGVDKTEALATFTASVLDENGDDVKFNGSVTLVFITSIATDKTASDIDVYQDGDKLTTGVTLEEGVLTLRVSHLSEFVVMLKDDSQGNDDPDPATPGYAPAIPANTTYDVANGSGSVDGGSWSTDKSKASSGSTVTITATPNEGYRVSRVTVKDAQGNAVEVTKTENGKYTFTMPKSKVEVSVTFAAIVVFTDVDDDAYYADAVAWAVENGITNGMGDDKFAPNGGCTRAHIVTFLWRAMGSPEADTSVIEFTDVVAGSYYEQAVAWAVANGITNGTSADKFSPNELCTRAQAVTFLWRAEKMPAASGDSTFDDVRADAYYADAVAWAVANEITNGTGNNNFSPKMTCTRAQIVTFLYRDMA